MPVTFQGRQQDRQQRPQAFAAYPVEASQSTISAARTASSYSDGRARVCRLLTVASVFTLEPRLLVIAGRRDELIEDLRFSAPVAAT